VIGFGRAAKKTFVFLASVGRWEGEVLPSVPRSCSIICHCWAASCSSLWCWCHRCSSSEGSPARLPYGQAIEPVGAHAIHAAAIPHQSDTIIISKQHQ